MIKISSGGGASGVRPARAGRAKSEGGAFSVSAPSGGSPATAAQETASASALGALIALQSGGERTRNRARADRMLMLLERLRDGLLAGRLAVADLQALTDAADAKLDEPDERIADLYAEISLRARVELAKLGR